MRRLLYPIIFCSICSMTLAGVPNAVQVPAQLRRNIGWQLALAHARFSPGMIDGRIGAKTTFATKQFQLAHGLPATGSLDSATEQRLILPGPDIFTRYTITQADAKLVTGELTDWNARAAAKFSGYFSMADMVCEKFHTTRGCLEELNPGLQLDQLQPGDVVLAPDVGEPARSWPRAQSIEVNLTQKTVRLLDADHHVIALFFCSIAASKTKLPSGSARVITIAMNPDYTFDPALWTTVTNVNHKLIIPPGPRNPVGLAWVGLSLPGYGIHGTSRPELIGKTGSHGCFRLTNWDATALANMVHVGMPVNFVIDSH